jgi:hypothetical protein
LGRLRQYSQFPYDDGLSQQSKEALDWLVTSVNTLVGQNLTLQQGFQALNQPKVNPANTQVIANGNRTASIASSITYVAAANSISFYWDGTNNSIPLSIYRDDNTIITPIVGNLTVSGLLASTLYYFYPYFQDYSVSAQAPISNITGEVPGTVVFAAVPAANPSGTPPVAYLAQSLLCLQRQALLDHIPLAALLATNGIMTGSGAGSGGSGGSPGGGTGGGRGFK